MNTLRNEGMNTAVHPDHLSPAGPGRITEELMGIESGMGQLEDVVRTLANHIGPILKPDTDGEKVSGLDASLAQSPLAEALSGVNARITGLAMYVIRITDQVQL